MFQCHEVNTCVNMYVSCTINQKVRPVNPEIVMTAILPK